MIKKILKYYPEFIVFGVISAVMFNAISPDLTWFNMAVDGTAYIMSAKYFYPAHKTSAPLYLLTGHWFTLLPFGSEYWRLALLSWLSAIGALIFVYLIVRELLKENKKNRLYALLAVATFGSSMMLISQAVVVVPFTMVTMFSLAAFYFALKKKWIWVAVMLGLGLATHHLILITAIVLFLFYKEMRNWKVIATTLSFLLFYLYIPFSKMFSDQPDMWLNTSLYGFLTDNVFTLAGLAGGVAIWDLPKRIFEMIGWVGVSLTIGLIPLIWYVLKQRMWKQPLFWLFMLPILYASTNLDIHVSRYSLPGIGFGAIIIAIAVSKLNKKVWVYGVAVASVVMLAINGNYFDFGRTIDPNLTAAKFYYEEYPKLKDGQIFLNMLPGGEWEMTFYYNKNEGKKIIPVCMGMLGNPAYQEQLRAQGVRLQVSKNENRTDAQMEMALSIARMNPEVMITKPTNVYDYGATLVPALGNESLITQWMGYEPIPKWRFKPANPYDIITGKLELTEWTFTLQSTWDFKFFFAAFMLGVIINWLITRVQKPKVENKFNEVEE